MRVFTFIIIVFGLLFHCSSITFSQTQYLYGGSKNDIYLGCITCNEYNSESIWNKHGTYGSKYSSESIWKKYGTYGSEYSSYCPWNKYSSNAPAVVDKEGNFYGYFSTNKYISDRVKGEWLIEVLDNWELIMDNFDKYVSKLNLQ